MIKSYTGFLPRGFMFFSKIHCLSFTTFWYLIRCLVLEKKKPDNATLVGIVYNSKSHMQSGSSIDLTYLWRYMCNKKLV